MIGVTAFGLVFTPAFYVVARWIAPSWDAPPQGATGAGAAAASGGWRRRIGRVLPTS